MRTVDVASSGRALFQADQGGPIRERERERERERKRERERGSTALSSVDNRKGSAHCGLKSAAVTTYTRASS